MIFCKNDLYSIFYDNLEGALMVADITEDENGNDPANRKFIFEYDNELYYFLYYIDNTESFIKSDTAYLIK